MTDLSTRLMPGVPQAARWLGLAGLIPFAALAVAVWAGVFTETARVLLLSYGIAILSFMGGCRWGLAAAGMGAGPSWMALGMSVLPAIYAPALILLPPASAMIALAAGFAVLLVADIALARDGGAPGWWPALRWPLTLGAATTLCAGAMA